jgi:very-short-patch-repair endonuclease
MFILEWGNSMASINELIDAITLVLSEEKSYDLPTVCTRYGLESGDESEAFKSRRVYVQRRLKGKDQLFLLDLAKRIINDYGSKANVLAKLVLRLDSTGLFKISEITRRNIMNELYARKNISGNYDLIKFLNRVWDLDNMPSTDYRFITAAEDIWQHMINNSDWDDVFLYEEYLEILTATDEVFFRFLEQVVHPLVRPQPELGEYIEAINKHLVNDGYKLSLAENISGYPVYKITKVLDGVKGQVKNLIFAAVGHKPEIVISDSINNDIKIVKHEENCLIYDRPIPIAGLNWTELVVWWADLHGIQKPSKETEIELYKRLFKSLNSEPEKLLFRSYFKYFKKLFHENLPALIPQVYLHYDPYTIRQREGEKYLFRQRMDFLLLFSNKQRVVIEIDGKQHYSDGDLSNPKKYAEMVKADRELKLNGYEVYRFGGYELMEEEIGAKIIKEFFEQLFKKHGVRTRFDQHNTSS